MFVAAVYRPQGNVKGFYHENISKGRFKKSYCKKVHTRSRLQDNGVILTTTQIKRRLDKRLNAQGTSRGRRLIIIQVLLANI